MVLMKEHECVVGELHYTDYSHIVSLSELKEHIKERLHISDTLKNTITHCRKN